MDSVAPTAITHPKGKNMEGPLSTPECHQSRVGVHLSRNPGVAPRQPTEAYAARIATLLPLSGKRATHPKEAEPHDYVVVGTEGVKDGFPKTVSRRPAEDTAVRSTWDHYQPHPYLDSMARQGTVTQGSSNTFVPWWHTGITQTKIV